jgi:hypothetical protein
VKVKSLLGEMTVVPKMVGLQKIEKGESVVHIEIESPSQPGTIIPFDIPVAELQAQSKKKR